MRRSEINEAIDRALAHPDCPPLPPWARWTPDEWKQATHDVPARHAHSRILSRRLGWNITDFGSGDFAKIGITSFTVQNATFDHSGHPSSAPGFWPADYLQQGGKIC